MEIREILHNLKVGKISIDEALDRLKGFPYEDLGFAKLDTHRIIRKGFPEAVFCEGKSKEQIKKILKKMSENHSLVLALRASQDVYKYVKRSLKSAKYYREARMIVSGEELKPKTIKKILIVTAGTADIPVAEEAFTTARAMGNHTEKLYDVGIAGVHRLFDKKEKLFSANVLVVIAGMEGALPGIVAGLVSKPVIAVPTSIGYGTSFKGLSALFTMLNSCSPGIAVVNIDNGFGAGYLAAIINNMNR